MRRRNSRRIGSRRCWGVRSAEHDLAILPRQADRHEVVPSEQATEAARSSQMSGLANLPARSFHGEVVSPRLISFGPTSAKRRLASVVVSPSSGSHVRGGLDGASKVVSMRGVACCTEPAATQGARALHFSTVTGRVTPRPRRKRAKTCEASPRKTHVDAPTLLAYASRFSKRCTSSPRSSRRSRSLWLARTALTRSST